MLAFFALDLRKFQDKKLAKLLFCKKHLPSLVWIMPIAFAFIYNNPIYSQSKVMPDSTGIILKTNDSLKSNDTFRISKDAIDALIDYKADDSTYFDIADKKAYLYGNANVKYNGLDLKAALIIVDFNKRQLYAKGHINDSTGKYVGRPSFNDGDIETEADTMIYNFETKRGRTYGIRMKEGEGYILCNKVFRDNDKSIYSEAGKYTTCNNPEPHFHLQTRSLKIIPEKKILFGPSNLVIENVPTPLFIPFGMFPVKKGQKSGILPPDPGLSGVFGPNLRNFGYYFGINQYFDQTFYGDIYFRGSWRLASGTRYAKRYKFNGSLNLEFSKFLGSDREDPFFKDKITRPFSLRWTHTQDGKARPGTSFSASVNIQKNNAAQLTSNNPTQIVTNEFSSSVAYSKQLLNNKVNFTTNVIHRQNTQTKYFSLTLPSFTLGVQRITPFSKPNKNGKYKWFKDFGISYLGNFENRIDTKDSVFFTGLPFEQLLNGNVPISQLSVPDQFKQGILHTLPITLGSYKFIKQHFTFTPSVAYQEYWYFKTVNKDWNIIKQKLDTTYISGFSRASSYSVAGSVNTNIFGTFQFRSKKLSAIRHTISPNIGFSYRPDFEAIDKNKFIRKYKDSQNIERTYSIYEQGIKGGPNGGESGSITFGIENNIQAKVLRKTDTSAKYENVNLIDNISMSGSYNFLADSFQLSNIGINGFTTVFNKLVRLNGSANLNPYAKNGRGKVFEWQNSKRIGTWTNASIQMTTGLNADMFKKQKFADTSHKSEAEKDAINSIMRDQYGYINFAIPWSVNINYSIAYLRANYKTDYNQTFSISGDFSITPKWKVGCNSGYDFNVKKISYTQFSISRNLHCWALSFNWIPDGVRKSFEFSLRANSSTLQDLKVKKLRQWFDQ